jgi:hypothetical protein
MERKVLLPYSHNIQLVPNFSHINEVRKIPFHNSEIDVIITAHILHLSPSGTCGFPNNTVLFIKPIRFTLISNDFINHTN